MKKNMFVLAGLVSALALVGCGKKEEAPAAPATPPAASAPAPAPAASAPAPAPAPAAAPAPAPAPAPTVASDLPPACEAYITQVQDYLNKLPEAARAQVEPQLKTALDQTREALKSIPDDAQKVSVCNQAAEMFKQMTAGQPQS